ncbi:MAG: GntR family transcriptional regulator [Rhodobacteraceae bacterium]|nr:GntR family transcriptional regulator [Paracoccaceae bacterium]
MTESRPAPPVRAFQPRTAADDLAARLRTALLEGRFAPGEAISIRRIAEAEGVSIIPARDALRALVAAGALEFRDSRTIAVPALDPDTLGQLRHARLAVEGELAGRAFAALASAADRIAGIDAEVTRALLDRDIPAYMRTNRALHFFVYEAAAAPLLLALADGLWLRFAPSMRILCEAFGGQPPRADFHQIAIAALRGGDAAGFRAAIEADIDQGMAMLADQARHPKHTPSQQARST